MKGKVIYTPSGRAAEYSQYAANFYNGCSGNCSYCYLKTGVLKKTWSIKPTLKKTLKNEIYALIQFKKEINKNLKELQEHGLFFTFTSDPFLRDTISLNLSAMEYCFLNDIPVKALTKQTWWIDRIILPSNVTIGFTLTGKDHLEPGTSSNSERIEALKYFHKKGYMTWASIETVIDIPKSMKIIFGSMDYVDHYKIGLLSGAQYTQNQLKALINISGFIGGNSTIYWKDEVLKQAGKSRLSLPGNCVDRNFKFWKYYA